MQNHSSKSLVNRDVASTQVEYSRHPPNIDMYIGTDTAIELSLIHI